MLQPSGRWRPSAWPPGADLARSNSGTRSTSVRSSSTTTGRGKAGRVGRAPATDEANLGRDPLVLPHDIAPLPHLFRILWLFWQMQDRMPEGRAWIEELLLRADALDDRGHAELLFIWAITATEVGDDDAALAALDAIAVRGRR